MATLMSGAKILLECLVREGVDCIFGYPGGVTLPLYDAMYENPIRHVLVRHEQNACFAAEGYARSTGRVGVCCATSGPGATNLVTGLVDALMDSIPVVAITGQVSTGLIGSDAFQEADTFGITRSCTKHNYLVKNIGDLPQVIHEAFHIASSGRPGPVLVDIPKDIFQGQAHYVPVSSIHLPGYKVFTEGHTGQIRRAAQMIWQAERPFVYAGGGIVASGASAELREFVELIDAPAVNTLMGLGALPADHPNFISMPGMHGSYAANMGMSGSDLLIALGVRFDDRVTGRLAAFAPHAKVIHVDIDPSEIGKNRAADLPIVGDCKRVIARLNKVLTETAPAEAGRNSEARRNWWRQIRQWKEEHPLTPAFSTTEIKPQHLMVEIDRISNGRAIVSADVGQHQMWAAQFIRFNEPRLWLNSGGLGSMGFGLPAAIGAAFANPDKIVFAVVGDGGFQMSIPELATMANYGLNVKVVVMNNGYLGMVRQWQSLFYNNRLCAVELEAFPDAAKLAGAYGFTGRTIESPADLVPALQEAIREPGPYLLNVRVSPNENVYPMVPAGAAINEMVLGPPKPVAVPK
ncbi:MAG: biosynthetic-type acetolactate synthase large subunit [Bryobacteraceae bacterium]|nr:biosynthetic-type acetolactate synthase large subunit [Bryobacterales bacterium]MEB2360430.1 biosynthetic-type acetolactate synthase large subunit [Bryobacterales bacterium]NUN02857.1 biosynthetic-type acetolactate synthase large subunit [Bryobacteraceae bacterium]